MVSVMLLPTTQQQEDHEEIRGDATGELCMRAGVRKRVFSV
jgi:hypothetical protein